MLKFYDEDGQEIRRKEEWTDAAYILHTDPDDSMYVGEYNSDLIDIYDVCNRSSGIYEKKRSGGYKIIWDIEDKDINWESIKDERHNIGYALLDRTGKKTVYADEAYFVYAEDDKALEELKQDYWKNSEELADIDRDGIWYYDGDRWVRIDTIVDSAILWDIKEYLR